MLYFCKKSVYAQSMLIKNWDEGSREMNEIFKVEGNEQLENDLGNGRLLGVKVRSIPLYQKAIINRRLKALSFRL